MNRNLLVLTALLGSCTVFIKPECAMCEGDFTCSSINTCLTSCDVNEDCLDGYFCETDATCQPGCREDADGDEICDAEDVCPDSDDTADIDGDLVPDGCDICPNDRNDDSDGDGVCDSDDACRGFPDDEDADNDGTPDDCDACPFEAGPNADADGDSVCNGDDQCDGLDDRPDADENGVEDCRQPPGPAYDNWQFADSVDGWDAGTFSSQDSRNNRQSGSLTFTRTQSEREIVYSPCVAVEPNSVWLFSADLRYAGGAGGHIQAQVEVSNSTDCTDPHGFLASDEFTNASWSTFATVLTMLVTDNDVPVNSVRVQYLLDRPNSGSATGWVDSALIMAAPQAR